jgi:adenine-specific DNA-methyltransferase
LQEQFKLWSYQYFWEGAKEWGADRVNQLQTLKNIAFKIIDFISQFEDELAKVWNKPKFVKNSNYVITLDRITNKKLVEKIKKHKNFSEQIKEWKELGIDKNNPKAPIDTKYFKDLELEILGLFDDLDKSLDGWLIKSENYQALNTILPKLHGKIQCIHIDPPYNTDTSGFLYANKFRHSSWLTMIENRLRLGVNMLQSNGSFLCHVDENEYERLKLAFDQTGIGDAGTIVWDKRNPMTASAGVALQHEYILWQSNANKPIYMQNSNIRAMLEKAKEIIHKHDGPTSKAAKEYADWVRTNPSLSGGEKAYRFIDEQGCIYRSVSLRAPEPRTDPKFFKPLIHPVTGKPCPVPPNGFSRTPETLQEMIARGEILFGRDETTQPNQKRFLTEESEMQLRSIIQDANKGKADLDDLGLNFPYCHPVSLYETLIGAAVTDTNGIIIDFFAGSGTTAHAVMKLNRKDNGKRKFILVEMGYYCETVLLPRIKKLSYSINWRNGEPQDKEGRGGFFKYYELEQYEEALANCKYEESDLFTSPSKTPYQEYVFMKDEKMLKAVEIDYEKNKVKVDLSKLHPNIDIAETLSNLTGKWIKKMSDAEVEFEDGTKINTKDLDYKLIKPLIWWE